ncbi:MAG: DUF1294 domain-containing protein [Ardenticatenaceae bacterium]|nr:DUF1294 domain-containing protein [Ardenticatenaceae bacterium]
MTFFEGALIWLLAINIITVVTYRYDKNIAGSNRRRIAESQLLLLALIGGSPAATIAMYLMRPRHKTRKLSFLWKFWGIIVVQIGLIWLYWQSGQRP